MQLASPVLTAALLLQSINSGVLPITTAHTAWIAYSIKASAWSLWSVKSGSATFPSMPRERGGSVASPASFRRWISRIAPWSRVLASFFRLILG